MPRPRTTSLALVALLFGALGRSGEARAHGGLPSGTTPFVVDGELVGAWTSYGVLRLEGGVGQWTAEESVGTVVTALGHADETRLLAGTARGLYETRDWGCVWTPVDDTLGTSAIGQLATEPRDPSHLFVFTDVPFAPIELYETRDGGDAWTDTDARFDGNFLSAVVEPGGTVLWLLLDGEAGRQLWRSDTGGVEWERLGTEFGERRLVKLLAPSALDDGVYLTETLIEGNITAARLLRVSPDDAEPEPLLVASLPGVSITSLATLGDNLFLSVDRTISFRIAEADYEVERLPGSPEICPGTWSNPGTLWGCGFLATGNQFVSSTDGREWSPRQSFSAVCPATCPVGSAGHAANQAIWNDVYRSGVGNPSCAPVAPTLDAGTARDAGATEDSTTNSAGTNPENGGATERDAGALANGGSSGNSANSAAAGCSCSTYASSTYAGGSRHHWSLWLLWGLFSWRRKRR